MQFGWKRVAVIAGAIVVCAAARAGAAPLEVTAAVTVNGLTGQHQVGAGRYDTYSLLPLPLGEVTLRSGADTLRVEGLPPVTIGYTGGGQLLSTRLSIVNGTLRHAFAGGWFAGAGQTIYNQTTQYAHPADEVQYSRVTGARFELGREFGTRANRIEVFGAFNPIMHGVQYTTLPAFTSCSFSGPVASCQSVGGVAADPESAAQVDLTARVAHRLSSHAELLAGLRYLNYTAHYDAAPGILADRNVGYAPSLGIRVRF